MEEPSSSFLEDTLRAAKHCAFIAGREIRNAWGTDSSLVKNSKKNDVDLVTLTDEKCEKMIKEYLTRTFPEHLIVGEEETAACGDVIPEMRDTPTWYVDPVDGTTNFIHSYPNSCVSIGLTLNKEPVVGVVFNPITREMFVGVKGKGSQLINVVGEDLNEEADARPIRVSNTATLKKALIATEIGVGRDEKTRDAIMGRIRNVVQNSRSVRCTGSCAMNMCAVASGRVDGFFEIGFGGPWDNCAATVIVREAGGVVVDPSGEEMHLNARRVLCANSREIMEEFVAALKPVEDGPAEPPKPSLATTTL
jgi:inositol-phosphate phosphatase/L-galactose 1-phosphate phosphatase